ncbi:HD domain-containing phosphohydrolase [Singulisphaera sp. PoT]|uniref:HD domain-containing phosphohydrolase n=1 Tax=Singulisphaera sp. PoT TaxID=3411797 RepID=UPI003BF4DB2C
MNAAEGREIRVLLVDDDEDDYLLTRELLQEIPGEAYVLEWVNDPEAGIREIVREGYDAILIDYRLGARDGLEIIREAIAEGCDAPLIVLTGQTDPDIDVRAMKAGASDFLAKGRFDARQLERSLRYAVWRKRSQYALEQAHYELEAANAALRAEVAERRRIEDELREREDRFFSFMNNGIHYACIKDVEKGQYLFINKKCEELFRALGASHPGEYASALPEETWRRIREADAEIFRTGNSAELLISIDEPGGAERFLQCYRFPITEASGRRLVGVIAMDVTAPRRAEEQVHVLNGLLARRVEKLAALRQIDLEITGSKALRPTLGVILEQALRLLQVDASCVRLYDPHSYALEYVNGRGFRGGGPAGKAIRLGEGPAGRAAFERRMIRNPEPAPGEMSSLGVDGPDDEGFRVHFAVPLLIKGQVVGVLELFHREPMEPDEEWLEFLDALANSTAIAIDNASMFDHLQRSNLELATAYEATIEGWSHALELRDRETQGHSVRVTEMTMRLARAYGLKGADLVNARRGALLHDIGKMAIPDAILLKPGPLNDAETELMRKHPTLAFEMLSSISFLGAAIEIPYCHHEKWDGSGYPRGLKGEQIPLSARLFAAVDIWDALSSDRPYRKAWPDERVHAYLREIAGSHLDPRVVEVFLEVLVPKVDVPV